MTIKTQRLVSFEDESIVLSFDWDDADGDVTLVRCVNTSPTYGVHVLIEGTGTGAGALSHEGTYAANSGTTEISIPPGQQPRYEVVPGPAEATVEGWIYQAETV